MSPLALILHLLNFIAPAVFMALVLPWVGRLVFRKTDFLHNWWTQSAIIFGVAVGVLVAGLWWFGHDGKMATYAALVVLPALAQGVLLRGWRA
jgi:type II secretory pathway component PulF